MKSIVSILLSLIFCTAVFCQIDMAQYTGNWEGEFTNPDVVGIHVELKASKAGKYMVSLSNENISFDMLVKNKSTDDLELKLGKGLILTGRYNKDKSKISAFMKSGILMYHLEFNDIGDGKYAADWNILMVQKLANDAIYLSVENGAGDTYQAYPFFGDQRFTGTWCTDFQKNDNVLNWFDFKTGLQFTGYIKKDVIDLKIHLGHFVLANIPLRRSVNDWQFGMQLQENADYEIPSTKAGGWKTADAASLGIDIPLLEQMSDSILSNALTNTHSVLVAKNGALVFEKYFEGYHHSLPHDQRSAAKSISGSMIGIAIDQGILENENQKLLSALPNQFQNANDSLKNKINIHHLLTNASGIDAVDFGIKRNSAASEDAYQNSNDWLKTVLEAPMILTPGTTAYYGSANPFLLGIMLNQKLDQPMENYMDKYLFEPLGITNYILQGDDRGNPYFGGGTYLLPRDMLKYGQLYLNNGSWEGQQVISKKWIEKTLQPYTVLENTNDKNDYGYLWYCKTYEVKGKKIQSYEARGAGGQYIFVVPQLDLVAAITSGNFRNGRFWQPELILEQYILPAATN